MKKKFIILVLGIVFVAAGYHYLNRQSKTVIVIISENGFAPHQLFINPKTIVAFKNTGSLPHWPASNAHPTHGEYPEKGGCIGSKLDACRGLRKGEIYQFVFNKIGVWNMHDHLFPDLTMNIVVKQNVLIARIVNFFSQLFPESELPSPQNFRYLPFEKQYDLVNTLSKKNPKTAWIYLKKALVQNNEIVGNGHEFSHIVGREFFKKYGYEGVTLCDNTFSYGCYHGTIIEALLLYGKASIPLIERQCVKTVRDKGGESTRECTHGLGHGLITMHNFNLPQALSDCDLLTSLSRNSCYLGVFMEYSFSTAPTRISLKNPWRFCTDLPVRYKAACANYLPHTLLAQNYDLDLPHLGKLCMNTSDQALWRPCISYVGALAAVTSLGEKSAILKECNQIRVQEGRIECIQSAAMRVTYEKYANWPENSKNLCNELPEEFVKSCMDKIYIYSN